MIDTHKAQFIQARWHHVGRVRGIRALCMHSMEAPEKGETAESTAHYFSTVSRPASAHRCFDNNSLVNCVRVSDTAFAAPGLNADGVHYEHAGYARQSELEWLDPFSQTMLDLSAQAAAQDCRELNIPVRRLTLAQVRDEYSRGLTDHVTVTLAFHKSDHTDPGAHFPWEWYLERVTHYYSGGKPVVGGIVMAFDPHQPSFLVKAGSPEERFLRDYIKGATKTYDGQKLADYQIIAFDPAGPLPSPIPPHSVGVGTFVKGWADIHEDAAPNRYGTLHRLMTFLGL
jgi:hypothetical protein